MRSSPAAPVPDAGVVENDARERTARLILLASVAVFAIAMAIQLSGDAYLRGDGSYYLRDAVRFANGDLPQSRYSPGFAFVLSPIVKLLGANYAAVGNVAIVLNAVLSVVAFGLLYGFLRTWIEPILAAMTVAVFALSQGVVTYFAEVRPEALCLVILTAMLLTLRRGRPGIAVTLGGLAMLVRIALAPLVVVTLAVSLRRRPKLLLATAALFLVAAVAYLATQSPTEQSYIEIGGSAYRPDAGGTARAEALLRTVRGGIVNYGRFGLPRLAVPFRVLNANAAMGTIVGLAVTGAMLGGVICLLRRRPVSCALLIASVAGFAMYLLTLLAWPVRPLSAVRLITPAPAVPMLGLTMAVGWSAGRLIPRRSRDAAATIMAIVLLVTAAGSVTAVTDHISDDESGRRSFVAAHEAVRHNLPPGRLMSSAPGASELLTGSPAIGYPIGRDVDKYADQAKVCSAVLAPGVPVPAATWIEMYRGRTLSSFGSTDVVAVRRPWCPESG